MSIPNVRRDDFALFLARNGYKVGAEIGVHKGEYGIVLCKAGLKIYGIDPFLPYDKYYEKKGSENDYKEAVEKLKGYDYTIIRKFSMDAAIIPIVTKT